MVDHGSTPVNKILDAALDYAARGWRVLPLQSVRPDGSCAGGRADCGRSTGKHPDAALVPHGLRDASADADTVRRWWGARPRANVAIATGPGSGLWAVDLDGPEGIEAFDRLEAQHGPAGRPLMATTQSGGLHLVYQWPADGDIGCRTRVGGLAIDTRGSGGYLVGVPSKGQHGDYRWEDGRGPADLAPSPAPPWLLSWVRDTGRPQRAAPPAPPAQARPRQPEGGRPDAVTRAAAWLTRSAPAIAGQNGHARAMAAVGTAVRGFGLGEAQALQAVADWNASCQPPWSEPELTHKVREALTTEDPGGRARGWLLDEDRPRWPSQGDAREAPEVASVRRLIRQVLAEELPAALEVLLRRGGRHA